MATHFDVSCLSIQGDGDTTVFGELFTEVCDETPQLHEVLIIVVQNGHNVPLQDRSRCRRWCLGSCQLKYEAHARTSIETRHMMSLFSSRYTVV